MHSSVVEVLIVGAGPVGLTMASALTHHGLTCRIIDKAPSLPTSPRPWSSGVAPSSCSMTSACAETFVEAGLKARGASIYSGGKRLVHVEIAGVESPFGFPLMIPQSETERLLSEHLSPAGRAVERGVELISFTERTGAVAATLRHADGREEPFETPWLIGCDGAHSTVRHTLGMAVYGPGGTERLVPGRCHVTGPLPADEVSVFWHEKGVLVFFPDHSRPVPRHRRRRAGRGRSPARSHAGRRAGQSRTSAGPAG